MPVRAIVFDLFDTLVDLLSENIPAEQHGEHKLPASVRAIYDEVARVSDVSFDAFAAALGEGARGFAQSHFAEEREVPTDLRFEDLARRLGVEAPGLPQSLTEVHMGILREQVVFPDHHPEVLATLAGRVKIGLCSNFSHSPTALEVLESGGFMPHLDSVVISDAYGLRKPRPEIFEHVLENLGVTPEETLHVGDSLRADIGGASPCGISTVWVTRRVRAPDAALDAHEGAMPDHVVADLSQLPGLLDRLGS
jgi:putative hydrolase of the HAD superfamily